MDTKGKGEFASGKGNPRDNPTQLPWQGVARIVNPLHACMHKAGYGSCVYMCVCVCVSHTAVFEDETFPNG